MLPNAHHFLHDALLFQENLVAQRYPSALFYGFSLGFPLQLAWNKQGYLYQNRFTGPPRNGVNRSKPLLLPRERERDMEIDKQIER